MPRTLHLIMRAAALTTLAVLCSACGAGALPIVPTARPTDTSTPTDSPARAATRTPTREATLTLPPATPTGGPSPTPLFGPTRTPAPIAGASAQGTRVVNPNAPRIEFFTTDAASVAPGDSINLYWSTRGTTSAVIYRLERGIRNQLWNVGPDGSLTVPTRRSDRGSVEFVLSVGDGAQQVEQLLSVPLACPDVWFFSPAPAECPAGPARETALIEQQFERGRMLYVGTSNLVYALFNDGAAPAWVVFENRYNPATDPESDPNFPNPPGLYQPLRILGFLWRGRDAVRNRLGLGIEPEASYNGFIQSATTLDGETTLYVTSADSNVLQLLPEGSLWQIINLPRAP